MTWPHGRKSAPKGSKRALRVKDADARQVVYKDFCNHIANGFSKSSWRFRGSLSGPGKGIVCSHETMESYIKDTKEFDPNLLKAAVSDGLFLWEKRISDAAIGKNREANIAGMQMFMRNVFKWDKAEAADPLHINAAMEHFAKISSFLRSSGSKYAAAGRTPSIDHNV